MKINNVFYLNLYHKIFTNPLTNQINELLLSIIIYIKNKWEVKDIFDTRSN